ncbi:MAG: group 1 truncated hemoglobin [Acidimicrobiia bacterium]
MQTIFERVGGMRTVSRMISTFYDRVLDTPLLSHYFDGVDMRTLIDHQTKFVAAVMGGPASYTDEHLARVHAHLHIDDASFEEVVLILRETMEDQGMNETDMGDVVARVRGRKTFIVTA